MGAVRCGDIVAIAEPGRTGRFFTARAFFCANIASLSEGFDEVVIVLFEKPIPGRAATGSAALLDALGLLGSFCRSFCAVESKFSIILQTKLARCLDSQNGGQGQLTLLLSQAKQSQTASMSYASAHERPGSHHLGPS